MIPILLYKNRGVRFRALFLVMRYYVSNDVRGLEIALSIWYVICFLLLFAGYSLYWFGSRRRRRYIKANLLSVPRKELEYDAVSTKMIYASIGCAAAAALILILLLLHVL